MITVEKDFQPVAEAIKDAVLVAWNGCCEICLAMDDAEADKFRRSDFKTFVSTPNLMLARVIGWYRSSCCLGSVAQYSRNPEGRHEFKVLVAKNNKEAK